MPPNYSNSTPRCFPMAPDTDPPFLTASAVIPVPLAGWPHSRHVPGVGVFREKRQLQHHLFLLSTLLCSSLLLPPQPLQDSPFLVSALLLTVRSAHSKTTPPPGWAPEPQLCTVSVPRTMWGRNSEIHKHRVLG